MARLFSFAALIVLLLYIWSPRFFYFIYSPYPDIPHVPATRYTLDNGMEVILIRHAKLPVVAHMVWYKVGSVDEPPYHSGMAHFLEHMMFQGTEHYPDEQFSHLISTHGGEHNAFTSSDFTGYYQYIAKEHLPLVMKLESDRMQHLVLKQDDFDTERKVIFEERRQRTDNVPRNRLTEQMRKYLFKGHGYEHPVIGWPEDLAALSLDDLQTFYRRHYSPANAVLVIVGDIEPDALKPEIARYYGSIPAADTDVSRESHTHHTYTGPYTTSLHDQHVASPELIRYYLAPSRHTEDKGSSYATELLAEYLGGSDTSFLYQKLVTEQKVAYHVTVSYNDLVLGPGLLAVHVYGHKDGSVEAMEHALDQSLASFLEEGIDETDLQRLQSMLYTESIYNRDSFKHIAQIYGLIAALSLPTNYIDSWPEQIIRVDRRDILDAAQHVLTPYRSITGVLLPEKKASDTLSLNQKHAKELL